MEKIEKIISEIENLPESFLDEVFDFVCFLKTKVIQDKLATLVLSESALKKDWDNPEEDEAWQHL